MSHQETVCVYVAASNHDANLLTIFLNDAGIPAYAVEDRSDVGLHTFGSLPGIHRPMVYVNRGQQSEAKTLIARYESRDRSANEALNEIFCYFCGAECDSDTIDCPKCGKYLEIDEDLDSGEPAEDRDQAAMKTSNIGMLRDLKKPVAVLLLFMPAASLVIGGLLAVAALTNLVISLLRG
jgi:hypothetical protein